MSTESGSAIVVRGSELRERELALPGHKHSAVPILAATLACDRPIRLRNVPSLLDIELMVEILRAGGARIERAGDVLDISTGAFAEPRIPASLARAIHGSVYLLPAVVGKVGRVSFPGAGGCPIGPSSLGGVRPIRHIVSVLKAFGVEIDERGAQIEGRAERMVAARIDADDYSTSRVRREGPLLSGASKTALIAGAFATSGPSIIDHPYSKLDARELWRFLSIASGRQTVSRWSTERIEVFPGIPSERRLDYTLPPDLSTFMTWIAVSALHRVPLALSGARLEVIPRALAPELALAEAMGMRFGWERSRVRVIPPDTIHSLDVEVTPEGIYSDHQPFFALMLLNGNRPARIVERVWPERFSYARELANLGADVEVEESALRIRPSRLTRTAELVSGDLRASAALVIAALAVPGATLIHGAHHLRRGYPDLVGDLRTLGASVRFEDEDARSIDAA